MGGLPHLRAPPPGMKVLLVTPAARGSRQGNRVTALRWARMLRQLGHRVAITTDYQQGAPDLLVALHARRSAASVARFHAAHPGRPIVVALTGTDLYHDLARSAEARRSLKLATRLIVLQPLALRALPAALRAHTRVLYQSVPPLREAPRVSKDYFDVCVVGHLRAVKDPLRAALASRALPSASRVRVLHVGGALDGPLGERARAEERRNPRYHWLGELTRARTTNMLARCRLLVLSSRLEGGANVIGEAIVAGVPVLASRIDGSVGLLGARYPGYFPVGDTAALTAALRRSEADPRFYEALRRHVASLRPLFDPAREVDGWRSLVEELAGHAARHADNSLSSKR